MPFSTPKYSSCGWSALNYEWHDISIISQWCWFYAYINSLKIINVFINNEITHFPKHCSSETCSKRSVKPTVQQKVKQNHLTHIWVILELLLSLSSIYYAYFVSATSRDESVLPVLFLRQNIIFISTHTLKQSRKKRNSSINAEAET